MASNLWSDAVNWVGDVAPVAGAALVFPPGAAQLTNTNDFAAGTAFDSLAVGLAFQFLAYGASFTGGVNLAVLPIGPGGANVIVTGPGPGGGPDVRVWSENGATILREFLAFDPAFLGGVFVG